jgi:hypothetical protein
MKLAVLSRVCYGRSTYGRVHMKRTGRLSFHPARLMSYQTPNRAISCASWGNHWTARSETRISSNTARQMSLSARTEPHHFIRFWDRSPLIWVGSVEWLYNLGRKQVEGYTLFDNHAHDQQPLHRAAIGSEHPQRGSCSNQSMGSYGTQSLHSILALGMLPTIDRLCSSSVSRRPIE